MSILFFIAAGVALFSSLMVITRSRAVHALLYLIVSLLAVAVIFFIVGAPFAAALEVIIYAGAIMVLFVFVVMMLNLEGPEARNKVILKPAAWLGPGLLTAVLAAELIYVAIPGQAQTLAVKGISPQAVSMSLFGPYLIGVELASILLMAGLVGAYHLAGHMGHGKRPDREARQ